MNGNFGAKSLRILKMKSSSCFTNDLRLTLTHFESMKDQTPKKMKLGQRKRKCR